MSDSLPPPTSRQRRASRWSWTLLLFVAGLAIWHVVDFPSALDDEFPRVHRPVFSTYPPLAYRLAEPGDTLDRVAIYLSAAMITLSVSGYLLRDRSRPSLWLPALSMAFASLWLASTPSPTFDGWHGIGWQAIINPKAPVWLRMTLVGSATVLGLIALLPFLRARGSWGGLIGQARASRVTSLMGVGILFVVYRLVGLHDPEPHGYWPRWAFILGLVAIDLSLLRLIRRPPAPSRVRSGLQLGLSSLAWLGLVALGISVTWYHRPLSRLRTVDEGKVYISAMPTKRGLEVAHARHQFKTIINLFPEDTPLRSPILPDELEFAKQHGIKYLGSPSNDSTSNDFLNETLRLATDPNAWPILVHCHGNMDRTPAWMGIYRFVVQKRPLDEILAEIEQHRGHRPKASVTLLYNRVLEPRAPEHYASDPTAEILRRNAKGTIDPALQYVKPQVRDANQQDAPRVSRRNGTDAR